MRGILSESESLCAAKYIYTSGTYLRITSYAIFQHILMFLGLNKQTHAFCLAHPEAFMSTSGHCIQM